mmetsp:Transcript_15973/g.34728  ORF Transcript_15973/g.34728 Transcript_15973/m.34728 type:complete len:238 (+) Transcript_15973:376-1089(+)
MNKEASHSHSRLRSAAAPAGSYSLRRTVALVSAVAAASSPGNTHVAAFYIGGTRSDSLSDVGRGRAINIFAGGRTTSFLRRSSPCRYGRPDSTGSQSCIFRTSSSTSSSLSMIAKSGGKEILTTDQFEAEVLSPDLTERPVLVFYSAPWCGPCRLSNPVVKEVMKEFAGEIDVVEVCTDDFADIASEAGVVSIPTIQLFYSGELIDTIVGCVAKNVLAKAVTKVLEESVVKDDEDSV